MLFWHRKVWLGNGDKLGQSVYWDTKEKKHILVNQVNLFQ